MGRSGSTVAGWIGCEIGRDSGALAVRGPLGKSLLGLSGFAGTGMGAGGTNRGGDEGNMVLYEQRWGGETWL